MQYGHTQWDFYKDSITSKIFIFNFQIKNKSWTAKKQQQSTIEENNNCDNYKKYLFNVLTWQSKSPLTIFFSQKLGKSGSVFLNFSSVYEYPYSMSYVCSEKVKLNYFVLLKSKKRIFVELLGILQLRP